MAILRQQSPFLLDILNIIACGDCDDYIKKGIEKMAVETEPKTHSEWEWPPNFKKICLNLEKLVGVAVGVAKPVCQH